MTDKRLVRVTYTYRAHVEAWVSPEIANELRGELEDPDSEIAAGILGECHMNENFIDADSYEALTVDEPKEGA